MSSTDQPTLRAQCVGSTGDTYNWLIKKRCNGASLKPSIGGGGEDESNLFREAQFSADGTTIITHNEDQHLRTFILPPDLLDRDDDDAAQALSAYASHSSPAPIHSYAIYPGFDLGDPTTTLVLSSTPDQPISLRNALDYDFTPARYPHVSPENESYFNTHSLLFTSDGTRFVAGGHNRLAIFDCSRPNDGPLTTFRTAVNRQARKRYEQSGLACQGIVNALSVRSSDNLLAAGTLQREVGLYEHEGDGDCIAAFSVADAKSGANAIRGTGITGLKWSPCGTYLIVAERQSDFLQVYDVRNTVQRVSLLIGRRARTTQKLGFDIVPTATGYEVWAGGIDGVVRMWSNPGSKEGEHARDAEIKGHSDPISSTIWHPTGAVLATCSGQRLQQASNAYDSDDSDDDGQAGSRQHSPSEPVVLDNSLRIWTM